MSTEIISDIAQAEQGTSLWRDAWIRLRRNKMAVFGLVTLDPPRILLIAFLTYAASGPVMMVLKRRKSGTP